MYIRVNFIKHVLHFTFGQCFVTLYVLRQKSKSNSHIMEVNREHLKPSEVFMHRPTYGCLHLPIDKTSLVAIVLVWSSFVGVFCWFINQIIKPDCGLTNLCALVRKLYYCFIIFIYYLCVALIIDFIIWLYVLSTY